MEDTSIHFDKHILLWDHDVNNVKYNDVKYVFALANFCGKVVYDVATLNFMETTENTILYICSDNVEGVLMGISGLISVVYVVAECSNNWTAHCKLIGLGEVPINIYNVGVYFQKCFDAEKDYYAQITLEHTFQDLTISNKPGTSYRKGIYLTDVKEDGECIRFKLLRCSTDLSGPTDNFRATDMEIINKIDLMRQYFFKHGATLNHVLAQTYHNVISNGKNKKAKISKHSDKTKDMPANGLIAFATFYKDYIGSNFVASPHYTSSGYDVHCNGAHSVLTKLRFRLKPDVTNSALVKNFDITLYPNSVFMIPLSTNRLYTHEIVPSALDVTKIPTRMGYVIRCSNTDAFFKNDKTYIVKTNEDTPEYTTEYPLEQPTTEGLQLLKQLYYIENTTIDKVNYDNFHFSMNKGDYVEPFV